MDIHEFIEAVQQGKQVIDTRSPAEYRHAHFPGAISIPLMSNKQRAEIGTLYKIKGREEAILKGFELIGPEFYKKIIQAKEQLNNHNALLYCWRGGLRSQIMSWILETAGYQISTLRGGYKAFRQYCLEMLNTPLSILIVGGRTGVGKTIILHHLQKLGEQILDLEKIASHRGSAFGGMGLPDQPSNEAFENAIAWELSKLDLHKPIWIENESRMIGKNKIPDFLYTQMREATVLEVQRTIPERIQVILQEYGKFPTAPLIENTQKLRKRLGGLATQQAINYLEHNQKEEWLRILFQYYDRLYQKASKDRDPANMVDLDCQTEQFSDIAKKLIEITNS